MTFLACGTLFLLASLCFVGTYQYLVPKFSGGAVSFATGDLWQKMLLGFVLTISTVILGYFAAQYLLMLFMLFAFSGGPSVVFSIVGAALLEFAVNSLFYGLQTWIFGRARSNIVRCDSFSAALRAGIAPGLVSTIISIVALIVFISNLRFD